MKEENEKSIGYNTIQKQKHPLKTNNMERASRYNYKIMGDIAFEAKNGFSNSLIERRLSKGISAREMSLALGQGAGYINDIENGRVLPSLAMLFEICEYLEITPLEFFAYTSYQAIPYDKDLVALINMLPERDKNLIKELVKRLLK